MSPVDLASVAQALLALGCLLVGFGTGAVFAFALFGKPRA
jgi:hypothetical protein